MLRKAFIGICVLALGSTAFAVVDIQTYDIYVRLTIQPFTQVWFQDDNWQTPPVYPEPAIEFSGTEGYDYYRAMADGVIGLYLPTTAASGTAEDPASTGYFESKDGATIWIESNADLDGTLDTDGDLEDGGSETLPTWFTIAVTGWDGSGNDINGFRLGNAGGGTGWVNDGVIPGGVNGGYAGNGNTTGQSVTGPCLFYFGNQAFWPDQDAFRMSTMTGWTFDLNVPIGPGTMKFLARVKRSGFADKPGYYTTKIKPVFTLTP